MKIVDADFSSVDAPQVHVDFDAFVGGEVDVDELLDDRDAEAAL